MMQWMLAIWYLVPQLCISKVTLSPTFQLWYDPMICFGQYHAAEMKCQSWALASKHLENHFFRSWTPTIPIKISPVGGLNTIRRAETKPSPQTNIQLIPPEAEKSSQPAADHENPAKIRTTQLSSAWLPLKSQATWVTKFWSSLLHRNI